MSIPRERGTLPAEGTVIPTKKGTGKRVYEVGEGRKAVFSIHLLERIKGLGRAREVIRCELRRNKEKNGMEKLRTSEG